MSLEIAGHKVLVKHMKFQERVEVPKGLAESGFTIELTKDQEQREEVATDIGTVVQVGGTAWAAFDKYFKDGTPNPDWKPWCKQGDVILFARYSGKLVEDPVSKERFMVINDEDVQAVVTGLKNPFED